MLTNIGWAMHGLVYRPPDFASYMLGILVTNLFLYFTFYIFMKVWHGEKILCHAIFHMVCAFLFGIPAMYFFINNAATWSVSVKEKFLFLYTKNNRLIVLILYRKQLPNPEFSIESVRYSVSTTIMTFGISFRPAVFSFSSW